MTILKIAAAAAVIAVMSAFLDGAGGFEKTGENNIFSAQIRDANIRGVYSGDIVIDIDFFTSDDRPALSDTAQVSYSVFYGRPEEKRIYHQLENEVLYLAELPESSAKDLPEMLPDHMALTIPCVSDELSEDPKEENMMTAVITVQSFSGQTAAQHLTFEFDAAPAQMMIHLEGGTAQDKYFSDLCRIKLQITEKNFDPSGVCMKVTDMQHQTVTMLELTHWHTQGAIHTAEAVLTNEGAYQIEIRCTDSAGNISQEYTGECVIDKTPPLGRIELYSIGDRDKCTVFLSSAQSDSEQSGTWTSNTEICASLSASDAVSGVKSVKYLISGRSLTETELTETKDWMEAGKEPIKITSRQPVMIYASMEDHAGNRVLMHSAYMMTDDMPAKISAQVMSEKTGKEQRIYSASDKPYISICVEEMEYDKYFSGLKAVAYEIICSETNVSDKGVFAVFEREKCQRQWTGVKNIETAKFGSGRLTVHITATDWAGNISYKTLPTFQIDTDAPQVRFVFDASDCIGTQYFNKEKVLTIEINEKNFDRTCMPKVTASCKDGFKFDGWHTNGQKHTGTVRFTKDGIYSVSFECADMAGNRSAEETLAPFVIDMTAPEIEVSEKGKSAAQGKYYRQARVMELRVIEDNFSAEHVTVKMKNAHTQQKSAAPRFGRWISEGKEHRVTVIFDQDGIYEAEIYCMDLAGNQSEPYVQKQFIIDTAAPKIQIIGVTDHSSHRGKVAPAIIFSDDYLTLDSIEVTLTGARTGAVDIAPMVSKEEENKRCVIAFDDFPDHSDDIYTLTASVFDAAGNRARQQIEFSVNRNGSAYIFDEATARLITDIYTNDPPDLVIKEINTDTLLFREITCSKDGRIIRLKEDEDYTVKAEEAPGQWKQYTYTIRRQCFEAEGAYCIQIYSEDGADNTMTNVIKAKKIEFVVDRTPPAIIVSDLEDGAVYLEETHGFTFTVKDRTIPVRAAVSVDGKLKAVYHREMIKASGGEFFIRLEAGKSKQRVTLTAEDAAGNQSDVQVYEVQIIGRENREKMKPKYIFILLPCVFLGLAAGIVTLYKYRNR